MVDIFVTRTDNGRDAPLYLIERDGTSIGCLMPPTGIADWSTRYPHALEGYLAGRAIAADDEIGIAQTIADAFPDDDVTWHNET